MTKLEQLAVELKTAHNKATNKKAALDYARTLLDEARKASSEAYAVENGARRALLDYIEANNENVEHVFTSDGSKP